MGGDPITMSTVVLFDVDTGVLPVPGTGSTIRYGSTGIIGGTRTRAVLAWLVLYILVSYSNLETVRSKFF